MSTSELQALINPGVKSLVPYQPGKPIEELQRELNINNIVKLASNENPLGCSPKAIEAIQAAYTGVARYPDGSGYQLKTHLAKMHDISPSLITLGNGSDDIFTYLLRAFVTQEHEVITSEYAFAAYAIATKAIGAQLKVVPAKHYSHDLEKMAEAVTPKTRMLFIAHPNNPTGTWNDKQSLLKLLDAVPKDVIVVIDQAYFEYMADDNYLDAIPLVERYPNLVATRTFSKAYGLASLRVGYSVSHAVISDAINRIRLPFNVNSFALSAALAAIQDQDFLQQAISHNAEQLPLLCHGLETLGLRLLPTAGNFVTVDLGQDAQPIFEQLLREGVIVRPLKGYNMPNHLRISVGLASENTRCLTALEKILA